MALSTVAIDRIIDLALLFAFGIVALIAFSVIIGVEILSGGLLLVLVCAIAFGIFAVSRKTYMERSSGRSLPPLSRPGTATSSQDILMTSIPDSIHFLPHAGNCWSVPGPGLHHGYWP